MVGLVQGWSVQTCSTSEITVVGACRDIDQASRSTHRESREQRARCETHNEKKYRPSCRDLVSGAGLGTSAGVARTNDKGPDHWDSRPGPITCQPCGAGGRGDVPNDRSIDRTQGYIPTTILWYCPSWANILRLEVTNARPAIPTGERPPSSGDGRAP